MGANSISISSLYDSTFMRNLSHQIYGDRKYKGGYQGAGGGRNGELLLHVSGVSDLQDEIHSEDGWW